MIATPDKSPLVAEARRIGVEVAAPAADDVDKQARFPKEAIDALKKARLLSAYVPKELGGFGCSVEELAGMCYELGQRCANAAMVFAMHQIQVGCLVRHGQQVDALRAYMKELSEKQLLLASATTEIGIGGDVRSSGCAVELRGEKFHLEKHAPVISYGDYADAILATSRRGPEAVANDQVISVCRKETTKLEQTSGWDTLGFRGTCSNGYRLITDGDKDLIVPTPYGEVSAQTMLPFSHITWTSLWLGLATDAVGRARSSVRSAARSKPGWTPPQAIRLADLMSRLQYMRSHVEDCIRTYATVMNDVEAMGALGFAIKMNNLKVGTSRLLIEVVGQALTICGIAGYKNDSKISVARHLRDAHGAELMVANDRILTFNAAMLLVYKDE
jgi:acyl-CoA dehydrogenase